MVILNIERFYLLVRINLQHVFTSMFFLPDKPIPIRNKEKTGYKEAAH